MLRLLRSPHNHVIAAGYGLGAAVYSALPEQIPPSWSIAGRGSLSLGGPMVAFLLPTAAAVTYALLRGLCIRHPINEASSDDVLAAYDAIMLRFTVFLMGVHATMLVGLLGMLWGREWAAQIVPVMLGTTMVAIGNLIPRTRPNLAIGIRTPFTLSDRALWIRTHRVAGYMVVACGAVIILSAIAVPEPVGPGMILLVAPAALVGTWFLVRSSGKHSHA